MNSWFFPLGVSLGLAVAGCGQLPRRAELMGGSVELVVRDQRPPRRDAPFVIFDPLLFVPVLPFYVSSASYYPQRSLFPELRQAVQELGLFAQVYGPGDDTLLRQATPYLLEVTLERSERTTYGSSYALGPFGLLLHGLGAPLEYVSTRVELRARCARREEAARTSEESGAASSYELVWLYGDSRGSQQVSAIQEVVTEALAESLAGLLSED